jgi:hypothetical protein
MTDFFKEYQVGSVMLISTSCARSSTRFEHSIYLCVASEARVASTYRTRAGPWKDTLHDEKETPAAVYGAGAK